MSPAPLLLLLIATACAALAHLLWGHNWLQLVVFWLAAFTGSAIAYASGLLLPLALPHPGGVGVLECVIGAWMLLLIVSRLRL